MYSFECTLKWREDQPIEQLFSSRWYIPDLIGSLFKPKYKDKDFLHQKYVVERLSLAQIASQISSSKMVVGKYLRHFEIPLRVAHQPHGRPSQPKYGARMQHGTLTPHLGEKRIINAIQELRGKGLTLRQIARFLSQAGVPTKCRGKRWHPQMVKRVIDGLKESGY